MDRDELLALDKGHRSRRGAEQGVILATFLTTTRKLSQDAYDRFCAIAGRHRSMRPGC